MYILIAERTGKGQVSMYKVATVRILETGDYEVQYFPITAPQSDTPNAGISTIISSDRAYLGIISI